MENNLVSFSENFLDLVSQKIPLVVVTMTNVRGSAPQNIGAKMIIGNEGILFGTVGGGKIEDHCIRFSQDFLREERYQRAQARTWNLQKDIGMTCGGEVSFLFESYNETSLWTIAVFGAGHISQQLTRTLLTLNCQVKVIDNRTEWLDQLPNHPRLTKIHNEKMEEEIQSLEANTFVALMTMGHSKDVPILHEALKNRKFPYLGVIGSQSKRNRMEQELKSLGLTGEDCERFICPLGEDIGSNSPAEIAISISAQLLRFRDKLS